ncbi:hypothetical protein PsorP6_000731 [Peronosclerospora sorghi]|uniref:Uncharacterized protein n=1 Tax=Peronosclerospora sorghi TaxID=230839 RepID=A0ACC0WUR3_9STRA|nr:hypothetical protein PsorP6_000731 [Peronosclerospora sorghi]
MVVSTVHLCLFNPVQALIYVFHVISMPVMDLVSPVSLSLLPSCCHNTPVNRLSSLTRNVTIKLSTQNIELRMCQLDRISDLD